MSAPRSAAVFLDRDGTLMEEVHYCRDPADVRVFPGTPEALLSLAQAGFALVLITNQSGIGRGIIAAEEYAAVHTELLRQIAPALLQATYFCPSAPGAGDPRRKPSPGMVREAAQDLGLDLTASWFVGDKKADVECGRAAGTRTVLVRTGYGARKTGVAPDFFAKDIVEAARIILTGQA